MTSKSLFVKAVCNVEVRVNRIQKTEFYGQKNTSWRYGPPATCLRGIRQKPCVKEYKPFNNVCLNLESAFIFTKTFIYILYTFVYLIKTPFLKSKALKRSCKHGLAT